MSDEPRFLDLLLAGRIEPDAIETFVDSWHDGHDEGELHDHLGMTSQEYGLWLRDPDMLDAICAARRRGESLLEAVDDDVVQARLSPRHRAARGS